MRLFICIYFVKYRAKYTLRSKVLLRNHKSAILAVVEVTEVV